MRNVIFTVVLLFLFANAHSQWYNNYNTGNDMKSVSFSSENTGWAVGANNTIVKTTNGGNNWFAQNCGLPFVTNFNSVFFSDNQISIQHPQARLRLQTGKHQHNLVWIGKEYLLVAASGIGRKP